MTEDQKKTVIAALEKLEKLSMQVEVLHMNAEAISMDMWDVFFNLSEILDPEAGEDNPLILA